MMQKKKTLAIPAFPLKIPCHWVHKDNKFNTKEFLLHLNFKQKQQKTHHF